MGGDKNILVQELLLVKLIKLVLYAIPEIEIPKRVGRPYIYSPQVLMCCFLVMVAKHESVRGLYDFLTNTEDYQAIAVKAVIPFPHCKIPTRRTFDRRLKSWQLSVQIYMITLISLFVKRFRVGIARLSLDNRMFEAFGALWHVKDIKRNHIPEGLRNIDKSAGWGVSKYRGWIFGHAVDIFVTTGRLIIPVIAIARSLKRKGNIVIQKIISLLPKVKKGVVAADSEYYDFKLDKSLSTTGRHLHAPSKQHPDIVPNSKTYAKRKTTVEPYFERFLQAFVLRGKLDRKGPNAWGYLVTCCFLYQLMVYYNLLNHNPHPLQVTHLIRML